MRFIDLQYVSVLLTKAVKDILKKYSKEYSIEFSDLLPRVLLQLPKLSGIELRNPEYVSKEVGRICLWMKEVRDKYKYVFDVGTEKISLKDLSFKKVPEYLGDLICEKFHYIGYLHWNSLYLGLFFENKDEEKISSLVSISPFDLDHVRPFLPPRVDSENVLVISRIYAFNRAPKYSISYLLGQTYEWLRQNKLKVKLLLTYLNKNVGFSGTSLKASNWILFGRESNIKYAYLDGKYITLRALGRMFQTKDINSLKERLGDRLRFSVQPLLPLEIYSYPLNRYLRNKFNTTYDFKKKPLVA